MTDHHTTEPTTPMEANTELTRECFSADKHPVPLEERLAFLHVTLAEFLEQLQRYPKGDLDTGAAAKEWAKAVKEGAPHHFSGQSFDASTSRTDALWRQTVDHDGVSLSAGIPRLGDAKGTKLTGDRALMRVTAAAGLGAVVQVPLWHTGIWLTLKAPSDGELLELDRRIAMEKIALGRDTNGMVYSNESVYLMTHLVNFALGRVYDGTVSDISIPALKNLILTPDYPVLIWGLLCTIYPNGYPMARPCTADPIKCQHVVKEIVNVSKLLWVDNRALTDGQRRHMAQRTKVFSPEDIARYQEAHTRLAPRTVKINEQLSVLLKVPTLQAYEDAGYRWVDGIVEMVDRAFATPLRGDARESYISEQARVSVLRQYGHWVAQVVVDGEEIIDDQETLERILSTWSSDDDITNTLLVGVGEYIDHTAITLVAVPKYNCPSCGAPIGVNAKHPHLIPLEVSRVFFTLLHQRLSVKLRTIRLNRNTTSPTPASVTNT